LRFQCTCSDLFDHHSVRNQLLFSAKLAKAGFRVRFVPFASFVDGADAVFPSIVYDVKCFAAMDARFLCIRPQQRLGEQLVEPRVQGRALQPIRGRQKGENEPHHDVR
jgi:hypothetical protein